MNSMGKTLFYGFLVWLIPFAVAFSIYKPLHETERDVFENTMSIVLVLAVFICVYLHFRHLRSGYLRKGIAAGVIWMMVSLGLDLLLFTWGPMAKPFDVYMKDIGMAYLVIPIITIGCSYMLERHRAGAGGQANS